MGNTASIPACCCSFPFKSSGIALDTSERGENVHSDELIDNETQIPPVYSPHYTESPQEYKDPQNSLLREITSRINPFPSPKLPHPLADDESTTFLLNPSDLAGPVPLQESHLSHVHQVARRRAESERELRSGVHQGISEQELQRQEEEAMAEEEKEINERRQRAKDLAAKMGLLRQGLGTPTGFAFVDEAEDPSAVWSS